MKAMETIQDLIEEAKLRTVWWALCIFSVNYFLSHASSSMWMNLPVSILFVSALRVLFNEVEFRWKVRQSVRLQSYLSHLDKKQLSVNDSRLSSTVTPPRWKRKIDSSVVEAAIGDFIDKILKDFVVDLWYADITPDKEAPELMRSVIMDAIGEISGRVKEINLVDFLTRDVVDLIGIHLDLFRRNQAVIGVDVMGTLSTEERDKRLKHHLMNSKELHPALVSPESEYKILKRLVSGILAIVLRPREAQCPLVRTIARELVTCLVLQPVMDLASPWYTNELIESILLAIMDEWPKEQGGDQSIGSTHSGESTSSNYSSLNKQRNDVLNDKRSVEVTDMTSGKADYLRQTSLDDSYQQELMQPCQADWARMLEARTQRRTEILTPENLENMWAKGRNYKRKENKNAKLAGKQSITMEKTVVRLTPLLSDDSLLSNENKKMRQLATNHSNEFSLEEARVEDELVTNIDLLPKERKNTLKRSNSTSSLKEQPEKKLAHTRDGGGEIITEFYSPDFSRRMEENVGKKAPDVIIRNEGSQAPKLKCRVVGAYFEKLGSKSFAVYSIAVTDVENRTWFVKRRYRNFERLHRHLKDIPNYTLHLPPKRIFSSSTEDAFVHQRCIQLDKYLQDLLSIANVAEQHEVWDFLSASSKNYAFGKSSSVMRTLAVNVDDAVDDIVRQFKGVSDGLMRTIVGSSSPLDETSSTYGGSLSWHADDVNRYVSRQEILEAVNSNSDNEGSRKQESHGQDEAESNSQETGWHSDNELNSKGFPPRVIKCDVEARIADSDKKNNLTLKSDLLNRDAFPLAGSQVASNVIGDPVGMPPEWTPSNVSVPLLNLVDKVFQLNRRGWLRRQVFWISKQILQLIMEDAIDDWLLRQIYYLRREETVALGIRWVQDIIWPGGTFYTRVQDTQSKDGDSELKLIPAQISQFGGSKASRQTSFEEQLEAARRVSNIKKMLFGGAPAALVSLIGHKQYRRCARDIFYFTQSTVCIKQLAYAILELLVISVFPELRDLLQELHDTTSVPPA